MILSKQQKTVLFMKRFNCVSNRFLKQNNNNVLSYAISGNFGIAGLRPLATNRAFYILDNSRVAHPFALMLDGKRRQSGVPALDLESYVGINGSIETFKQGFAKHPNNKDCWYGYEEPQDEYYCSLYFNLGRAFLRKMFGIPLPYVLPPAYEKLFTELK